MVSPGDIDVDKKWLEIGIISLYQIARVRTEWTKMVRNSRPYERSHPWLSFHLDLHEAGPRLWLALGEAQSKCQHIAGVPLQPVVAEALHTVYLAKGIRATTAIEGNTLSESEVRQRIEGKLELPHSKEYLGREVDNILSATNKLLDVLEKKGRTDITPTSMMEFNQRVLHKLELEKDVEPGKIRKHSVVVGRYQGAPPEDCEFLLGRLCDWLNDRSFSHGEDRHNEIAYGILKAIVAHIYFAWIHAFGDGNGRTARLLEVKFLLESGVPSAAAHLLSNHYNLTREEYYRQLDNASKSGGNLIPFIEYAVQGFTDQLRQQLQVIRGQQWNVAWVNFVHEVLGEHKTEPGRRQRKLVLALSASSEPVPRSQIRRLTAELAEMYAGKEEKTLTRDLNAIVKTKLVEKVGSSYRACRETILAFLPRINAEQLIKAIGETKVLVNMQEEIPEQMELLPPD